MKFVLFTIIAILIVTQITCDDAVRPSAPEAQRLFGSWNWIKSVGGFGGETLTPESTGTTVKLVFQYDGTFLLYVNDTLNRQSTYYVQKQSLNPGWPEYYYLWYSHSTSPQQISYQGSDTLMLFDQCYDCYLNTYVRITQ